MAVLDAFKARARELRQHTLAVYYAARDPRTPLWVRLMAAMVAAYAFSPIDLIPDFIPVIGYLDDLVLIPMGLALVVRFTPPEVMASARERALQAETRPVSIVAAVIVIGAWSLLSWAGLNWLFPGWEAVGSGIASPR